MNRKPLIATLALAIVLTPACAKKQRPEDLPPAPSGSTATGGGTGTPEIRPGSQEDFIRSIMADRVFFDTDRFDIDAEDQATLRSQAEWLIRYPSVRATIEGHCDERGTRDYNLALGERRANAAKNYLVALGVDAGRVTTISYGKERPEALGSDEAAWAKNRRAVTVTVQ